MKKKKACDYVETGLGRYLGRRQWTLTRQSTSRRTLSVLVKPPVSAPDLDHKNHKLLTCAAACRGQCLESSSWLLPTSNVFKPPRFSAFWTRGFRGRPLTSFPVAALIVFFNFKFYNLTCVLLKGYS